MKPKESINKKWFIDITEPTEKILSGKEVTPIKVVNSIMEMIVDSMQILRGRILDSKNHKLTDKDREIISAIYISMLSQSIAVILKNYAMGSSEDIYILPDKKINMSRMFFSEVLSADIENPILNDLFLNYFMLLHINMIIGAYKCKEHILKERKDVEKATKKK